MIQCLSFNMATYVLEIKIKGLSFNMVIEPKEMIATDLNELLQDLFRESVEAIAEYILHILIFFYISYLLFSLVSLHADNVHGSRSHLSINRYEMITSQGN